MTVVGIGTAKGKHDYIILSAKEYEDQLCGCSHDCIYAVDPI